MRAPADRIAIMARGRLKALGSSIRLKQKFGSGYQVRCRPPHRAARMLHGQDALWQALAPPSPHLTLRLLLLLRVCS